METKVDEVKRERRRLVRYKQEGRKVGDVPEKSVREGRGRAGEGRDRSDVKERGESEGVRRVGGKKEGWGREEGEGRM